MDYLHTHQTSDTTRITVTQDYSPESPLEWDTSYGLFTISKARGVIDLGRDYNETNGALQTILDEIRDRDIMDEFDKHFTRAGMAYKVIHLRGYSQSEWAEVVIYSTEHNTDVLGAIAHTIQSWWRGDVYTISVEKLVTYANVTDLSDTHTHWEHVTSVGGYYLDDYSDNDELELLARDLEDMAA